MLDARALLRSCALVAWCALATACYDTAILGDDATCDPACSGDERCDPLKHVCVGCVKDDDCSAKNDGAPFCNTQLATCAECRRSADCGDAGLFCIAGECRSCSFDPDCATDPHCDHSSERCGPSNRGPGNGGSSGFDPHPR